MGCLRVGGALIFGIFFTLILVIIATIFGVLVTSHITGNAVSMPTDIAAPLELLLSNTPGALIGAGIGLLIGLLVTSAVIKRASDINWLVANGTRIYANIKNIERHQRSRTVNSGTSMSRSEWYTVYRVVAQWTDPASGITHTFHSDDLSTYPRHLSSQNSIAILIDPNNPKRYYMKI